MKEKSELTEKYLKLMAELGLDSCQEPPKEDTRRKADAPQTEVSHEDALHTDASQMDVPLASVFRTRLRKKNR